MRLDVLMSPLILFRAARTSPQQIQINGTVTLDKMLINVGGGWDACNSRFVAPQDGVYFFSWSSASGYGGYGGTHLLRNNVTLVDSQIGNGFYNGSDTASHSILLQLNSGESISLIVSYTSVYSDANYQTSLLGFLYEPIFVTKVAWSLAFNGAAYGPTKIPFNSILLLEGITWNSATSQLTIPTTGTHYLKLSGIPFPRTYKFKMGLVVNSQPRPLMSVMEEIDTVRTHSYTVRTRALVTSLREVDTVEVSVPTGYEAGHDQNTVMFAGFLIF